MEQWQKEVWHNGGFLCGQDQKQNRESRHKAGMEAGRCTQSVEGKNRKSIGRVKCLGVMCCQSAHKGKRKESEGNEEEHGKII